MQTITNVTLYKCDYCSKKRQTKAAMQNHEPFCRNNPNNKHDCFTCAHLEVIKEPGCTYFACKKLNKELYSYKAEQKKLLQKYPDEFADKHRMPLKCLAFEHQITYLPEEAVF